jgi:hypothetical protein
MKVNFTNNLVCERVWLKKDMTLRKPDGRGRGVTVVGAISEKLGLIHYSILQESNNTQTFSTFISQLVQKIKGDAYVYMDNLSVHNARIVKDHFNDRIK